KAYAKLEVKCKDALQDLDKNPLVLDMRAEIETLQGQVNKLHGEFSRIVLEEKKWINYDMTLATLGFFITRLVKTTLVHGRCIVFKEVADLKEPFKLKKMPGYRPSSKKEFDQAGENLATSSYPFLVKATVDPYALWRLKDLFWTPKEQFFGLSFMLIDQSLSKVSWMSINISSSEASKKHFSRNPERDYTFPSISGKGKALVERNNMGFDLTKSDLYPSFFEDLTTKGVGLREANFHTGIHREDGFTPLETIQRFLDIIRSRSLSNSKGRPSSRRGGYAIIHFFAGCFVLFRSQSALLLLDRFDVLVFIQLMIRVERLPSYHNGPEILFILALVHAKMFALYHRSSCSFLLKLVGSYFLITTICSGVTSSRGQKCSPEKPTSGILESTLSDLIEVFNFMKQCS
nr:hypothetical protein [Tanacetum cinerariifolium]